MYLFILTLISLSIIVIQDLKLRAVYWFLFPIIFGLGIIRLYPNISATSLLLNFGFLVTLMTLLTIYVSLRQQQLTNITKGFFNWGDILFLASIIPFFEFPIYVYFVTFGTIFCLICHLLVSLVKKQENIPFAGYLALLCIAFLSFEPPIIRLISTYSFE